MPTVEITWRAADPVTPEELAFDKAYAARKGYTVHEWPDTNASRQRVTLTRIIADTGQTMALYETTEES